MTHRLESTTCPILMTIALHFTLFLQSLSFSYIVAMS